MRNANSVPKHDSGDNPWNLMEPQDQLTFDVNWNSASLYLSEGIGILACMSRQSIHLCGNERRDTIEFHRGLRLMHKEAWKYVDPKKSNPGKWTVKGDISGKPPNECEKVANRKGWVWFFPDGGYLSHIICLWRHICHGQRMRHTLTNAHCINWIEVLVCKVTPCWKFENGLRWWKLKISDN